MDNPVLPPIVAPKAEQLPPPIATWRPLHRSGQFEFASI